MQRTLGRAIFAAILMLVARGAIADVISVDENASLFGTLNQRAITACGNNTNEDSSSACGPVAATNSFVYLQNQYPGVYSNNLVQGTPENTAGALATYMNCTCADGTTIANFISGKEQWIDTFAPNTTKYEIQNYFASNTAPPPDLAFLASMLAQGEDVELLVGFYDGNTRVGGHYLTLTGASCDDNDNDGICGAGDTPLSISYDDPWGSNTTDPDAAIFASNDLTQVNAFGDSFLQIDNYLTNGDTTLIEAAVAESPIPEPGPLPLLATSLLSLAVLRRRWRNRG